MKNTKSAIVWLFLVYMTFVISHTYALVSPAANNYVVEFKITPAADWELNDTNLRTWLEELGFAGTITNIVIEQI